MRLAERLRGEIVGADSRQIYLGLEIGTEAPTQEDRARVVHHLVAFLNPAETYSAGRYGLEARAAIREIESRGNLPIVAGGSGLYIRAALEGLFEGPPRDDAIRARLTRRIHEEGWARSAGSWRGSIPRRSRGSFQGTRCASCARSRSTS